MNLLGILLVLLTEHSEERDWIKAAEELGHRSLRIWLPVIGTLVLGGWIS